nr:HalX domain-containing protein [Halovenus rubra]
MVVDDEEEVADVYALRLRNQFETRVAYSGSEALDVIDIDVDIVLLDRRMPDIAGDEVLTKLREKGYDCRVIMLTAVDPGLDIVSMQFDDYLCKPVEKEDLVDAINHQLDIIEHDETVSEYFELTSKLALLESELSEEETETSDEVAELRDQVHELREELDDVLDEIDDIEAEFSNIGRFPG